MNQPLNTVDKIYHELVAEVLEEGQQKGDRTGTGTKAVVGRMAHFNLNNGRVPRLTTKPIIGDNPEEEMFWFISGDTSIKMLRDKGIGIWNSWLIPGTAKYRTRTIVELISLLAKKYDATDAKVHFTTVDNLREVQKGNGINVFDKFTVKLTLNENLKKTVEIYGSDAHFTNAEGVVQYAAEHHNIAVEYLTDGDIGKGGYGAQWRHWEDTQIVPQAELHDYYQQGYTFRGEIAPVGVPGTEEGLLAGLDHVAGGKGYVATDIVKVQFDEVGDKGYDVYNNGGTLRVRYHDDEGLRKVFTVIADLPRFVVHREIDQLVNAIQLLKHNPDSRRIIVSAWNPALTWKAALPPCHLYFQFISHELTVDQRIALINDRIALAKRDTEIEEARTMTANCVLRTWADVNRSRDFRDMTDEQVHAALDLNGVKRRNVNCFLLLRSNDLGLGMPFNITQYAALTHMVAQVAGMEPGELVWAAVDAHVYNDHVAGLTEQLSRESIHCIPRLVLDKAVTSIDDFNISKMKVIDYQSQPALVNKMLPSV